MCAMAPQRRGRAPPQTVSGRPRGGVANSGRPRSKPRAGANRGAAATYVRACTRCGCTPAPDVAADLAVHGALVLDLRLCSSEALAAICAFLREAPGGVVQVVFRDGLFALGADKAYRDRAAAVHRRPKTGAFAVAPLRLLMAALAAFLTVHGSRLTVLDLAGAQLGHEVATLLTPLARALRDCRVGALRWLGLSGCRLGDTGLSLLLPCLAGKDSTMLRLEALTLANNYLVDVRLITVLLRTRARLCCERRARPLQLLDLSSNPRLGDSIPSSQSGQRSASARRRDGKGVLRPGACERPKGRRERLVRSVACAIAEGLPLRVLRLRRMALDEEALHPLLQLMQVETQRCTASDGALAGFSGFCLEQLDLDGNDLEASLLTMVNDSLNMLREFREGAREEQPVPLISAEIRKESSKHEVQTSDPLRQPRHPLRRRVRSEPVMELASAVDRSFVKEALVRNAISEGEEFPNDHGADKQCALLDPCVRSPNREAFLLQRTGSPNREAFLLQRTEDRRRFRKDLADLSKHSSHKRWESDASADTRLESWAETQMIIAGVLGPSAAQSMVRQMVLGELGAGFPHDDGTTLAGPSDMSAAESVFVHSCRSRQPKAALQSEHAQTSRSVQSSDEEVDTEAQLLRANRLEQLRTAVLGALAAPAESSSKHAVPALPREREHRSVPPPFAHGELSDLRLNDLSRDCAGNSRFPTENSLGARTRNAVFDMKIDEMHREALFDLRRKVTTTDQLAEELKGFWG